MINDLNSVKKAAINAAIKSSENGDHTSSSAYPIIDRDDLEIGEQLSVGSFGAVYRGKWKPKNLVVAVKKVFMLEKEAYILSRIRHRNIIQLYGVCHTNREFYIVTEFAEMGSLYDFLHNPQYPDLSFADTLTWAIQIAQGVHYLHYEAPDTIIHRDLKSKNVVLNQQKVCKLCDFGTSKNLTHSQTQPTWGGTAAWMSPEIIKQSGGLSTATDVWSYAVVLWEMMSREIPYDGLTEFRIYTMIAEDYVKLAIPDTCPEQLAKLMNDCWKVVPKERANFKTILSELNAMTKNADVNKKGEIFVRRKESWRFAIDDQLIQLKTKELDLIQKTAELERREKALKEREASQRNLLSYPTLVTLDDASTWDEEHVCAWVISLHLEMDISALDALVQSIQRNNINGNRLFDLSFNDLDYLGVKSYGVRKELLYEITALQQRNERLRNFPSLATTHELLRQQNLEKTMQPFVLNMILHVAMLHRATGSVFDSADRFKVLVDCDWLDPDHIPHLSQDLREPHSLIQSVCITLHRDKTIPMGEPSMRMQAPFGLTTEWLDVPMEETIVTVVCMVTFADRVMKPRSSRVTVEIADFSCPQTLLEKNLELTVRAFVRTSHALDSAPTVLNGVNLSTSSGRLQGFWRERSSLSTSVDDIPEEPDNGYRPRSGSLSYAKTVQCGTPAEDDFFRPRTASGTMTKSPMWSQLAAGLRAVPSSEQFSRTNSSTSNASDTQRPRCIRTISEEESTVKMRARHRTDRFEAHFGRGGGFQYRLHPPPNHNGGVSVDPYASKPPVQRRKSSGLGDGSHGSNSTRGGATFFLDSSTEEWTFEAGEPRPMPVATQSERPSLQSQRSATTTATKSSRRKSKQRKSVDLQTMVLNSVASDEEPAKRKPYNRSAQVHGGYKKWAWKG
uniref:Mitogen-activated protein kinase kinase kinase n=1 Tax=Plectus sambesii TaxID=2011161 RepID=A0A914X812_9BILA